MQTLMGTAAKGTTSKEFVKMIKKIVAEAAKLYNQKGDKYRGRGVWEPLLSYDNPCIHAGATADLEEIGITQRENRVRLPEYSPDFYKVIEHVHSNLQQKSRDVLRDDASINTPMQYVDLLFKYFKSFKSLDKGGIVRDVQSLPETYQEVHRLKGGWPHKRFR